MQKVLKRARLARPLKVTDTKMLFHDVPDLGDEFVSFKFN
jgi:hypothetical protein